MSGTNPPSNTRSLPELLLSAERRVNAHVFRRGGDDTLASIPANRDRDVDLLLCEAADELKRMTAALRKIADTASDIHIRREAERALQGETRAKHRFTAEAKEGYCIHCGRVMGEHSKGDLCCPETTGVTP